MIFQFDWLNGVASGLLSQAGCAAASHLSWEVLSELVASGKDSWVTGGKAEGWGWTSGERADPTSSCITNISPVLGQ